MIIESGLVKAGLVKTGLVRAISNINTRYFRYNEGSTDYAAIPDVGLVGDYSVSVLVYKVAGERLRPFGNSADFNSRCFIEADGSVSFRPSTAAGGITAPAASVPDSVLGLLTCERSGSNGSIYFNGTLVASGTVPTSDGLINVLYRNSAESSQGVLSDLNILISGVLVRRYPLDDNGDDLRELVSGQNGTIINGESDDWVQFQEQSNGEWEGVVERWVNPLLGAQWTDNGGGSYSIDSPDGGINSLTATASLTVGRGYAASYSLSEFSSVGGQAISFRSPSIESTASTLGVQNFDFTSGASSPFFVRLTGGIAFTATLEAITIKELLQVA